MNEILDKISENREKSRELRVAIHEIVKTANGIIFGNFECVAEYGHYATTVLYLSNKTDLIVIEICKEMTNNTGVTIELHRGISSIEHYHQVAPDNQYNRKLNLLSFNIDFPAILQLPAQEQIVELYQKLEQIINTAIFLSEHFDHSYLGVVTKD